MAVWDVQKYLQRSSHVAVSGNNDVRPNHDVLHHIDALLRSACLQPALYGLHNTNPSISTISWQERMLKPAQDSSDCTAKMDAAIEGHLMTRAHHLQIRPDVLLGDCEWIAKDRAVINC